MYFLVIGLEIHIQSKTNSKMFCSCSSQYFGKEPNTNTCPTCTGMPGALPVINSKAIENCLRLSLALDCEINKLTKFDRKNYFYPDLPKGYQISQYDLPIGHDGFLGIEVQGDDTRIRIRRVHEEEDTAKSLHEVDVTENGASNYTLIDFNKSGVALIEVVTEPDFTSTKEVFEFAKALQKIVRYLEVSDANMEMGQMRFELNISLRKEDQKELPNYKVDVKNISSISVLEKVINYEIQRQTEILEKGETPLQETRGIDDKTGKTFSQRLKEGAEDYRYFPDPDLPILTFTDEQIEAYKNSLPELPISRKQRFISDYHLDPSVAGLISDEKYKADWYEEAVKELENFEKDKTCDNYYKEVIDIANFIVGDIEALCKKKEVDFKDIKLTKNNLAESVYEFRSGKISASAVKKIIEAFLTEANDVKKYIETNSLVQISDLKELEKIVEKVIEMNQDIVTSYKSGKVNAKSALVGQVMRETKGKANPLIVDKLIVEKLVS